MDNTNTSVRSHVIIVGTGAMGRDIAAIFLARGWTVDCISRDSSKLQEATTHIERSLMQIKAPFDPKRLRVHFNYDGPSWSTADLVIETVPEDLETKRQSFSIIDSRIGPDTPVGSNASGIPISKITEGLSLRARAVGLHFFQPAHLVPLVEVVHGVDTDPVVAEQVYQVMKSVGSVPVMVNRDTPGFLANRIQHALMREVFAVLDEGLATARDIDTAVRFGFGMRYVAAGPLMQKEFAGLDTQMAAAASIYPFLSQNMEPSETLKTLVNSGHFGTKSLQGIWNWTEEEVAGAKSDYDAVLMETLELLNLKNRAGTLPTHRENLRDIRSEINNR